MSEHMNSDDLKCGLDGAVMVIAMDRAEKKNALTTSMYTGMADALEAASGDDNCRVALIKGAPGVFCAGNDIGDFIKAATGGDMGPVMRFLNILAKFDKPLVACVDGVAVGVGTTMLMHCDLVYSSARSMFQTPFVDLGLVPEAGSSYLAPKIMGHQRAFALLGLGEKFSAEAAHQAGLVNVVSEDVDAVALAQAQGLAAKPPEALRISRDLVRGDREELYSRMMEEGRLFAERLKSGEAQSAFAAFMMKGK